MKVCPTCQSTYTNDSLQFCLEDGSPLNQSGSSSDTPTLIWSETETVIQPNLQTNSTVSPTTKSKTPLFLILGLFFLLAIFGIAIVGIWLYLRQEPTIVQEKNTVSNQNNSNSNLSNSTENSNVEATLVTPTTTPSSMAKIMQEPPPSKKEIAQIFEKAEKESDNFESQFNAGLIAYAFTNGKSALKYFEKAHLLKPDDYETIVNLGNVNFDMNKFAEAEKWYEKALEMKNDDLNVRTDYGTTFLNRQPPDVDRAIKEYQTSLSISPNHEQSLQNLAYAYFKKKDTEALKEVVSNLEKVNPKNELVLRWKKGQLK